MKNGLLTVLCLLIVLFALTSTARAEYKEGKWAMTMVTKMENMPPEMAAAMKQMENMPPEQRAMMEQMEAKMGVSMSANGEGMTISTTQCMTKKNPIPNHNRMKSMDDCQQTHEFNGDTVTFHVTCNRNDFQMESSGKMTYSGDTMQGHIKSHQVKSGKSMDTVIDISGQYLGPCSQ
jgi:hypothetical protein